MVLIISLTINKKRIIFNIFYVIDIIFSLAVKFKYFLLFYLGGADLLEARVFIAAIIILTFK